MTDDDECAYTDDEHDYDARERYLDRMIRLHRRKQKLTQQDLADEMQEKGFRWDQPTVARVENGQRRVSFRELAGLLDVLNVDQGAFWIRLAQEGDDEDEDSEDS